MVGIHSTVEKRAKRMPDITVETTKKSKFKMFPDFKWLQFSRAVPSAGHLGHLPQAQQLGGAKLGISSN